MSSHQDPSTSSVAYPSTADALQNPGTTSSQPYSRQAAEDARKDRTLAEFMLMLDDYEPLVSFPSHLSRYVVADESCLQDSK